MKIYIYIPNTIYELLIFINSKISLNIVFLWNTKKYKKYSVVNIRYGQCI